MPKGLQRKVIIASTFPLERIPEVVRFWIEECEMGMDVVVLPESRIFREVLDPDSDMAKNRDGANVILVRSSDVSNERFGLTKADENDRDQFSRFRSAILNRALLSTCPWIVVVLPADAVLIQSGRDLCEGLIIEAKDLANLSTITADNIEALYPTKWKAADSSAADLGGVYSPNYQVAIGTSIGRTLFGAIGRYHKVIAVDCDETLWSGICGEVGPFGVVVTDERREFQELLACQQKQGVLLCICSKNNAEDIDAVFDVQRDMPLSRSEIVSVKANWERKSDNLLSLARELNVRLDSFIFFDDEPVECAEVRAGCPAVTVIQVPRENNQLRDFVRNLWIFDSSKSETGNALRTTYYRREQSRQAWAETVPTMAEFVKGLDLRVLIELMRPEDLSRVVELGCRVNQFNCAGTSLDRTDLLISSDRDGVLVIRASDKFGEYGCVGAVVFDVSDQSVFVVRQWLLSCRALGRGIEETVVEWLGSIASGEGCGAIEIVFRDTGRNGAAATFLRECGCSPEERDGEAFMVLETVRALTCRQDAERRWSERHLDRADDGRNLDTASESPVRAFNWGRIALELSSIEKIRAAIDEKNRSYVQQGGDAEWHTATEQVVGNIWREVLGITNIGRQDGFFRLGGDSLLAIRVLAKLNKSFDCEFPIAQFFEDEPTVAGISEVVDKSRFSLASPKSDGSAVIKDFVDPA